SQWAKIQKEVVTIGRGGVEWYARPGWLRLAAARTKAGIEPEIGRQHKRAVVINIITQIVVGRRRLGRCGDERRMRINHARRDVKAGLRNADHSGLAVVVRNGFEQPFDGVISVRAFVNLFRGAFVRTVRSHLLEFAFGHIPSARVLIDEDEPFLLEMFRWPE